MGRWLRELRGAVGNAMVWGLSWFGLSFLIGASPSGSGSRSTILPTQQKCRVVMRPFTRLCSSLYAPHTCSYTLSQFSPSTLSSSWLVHPRDSRPRMVGQL